MAELDRQLNDLTSQLHDYHVEEPGLSFVERKLKLNDEKDAEIVAKEIEKCTNLTVLNLDGNTVGVDAAKRIAESLSSHGEFKRAIWKNMFTGRTKEEIPDALRFLGDGVITAKAHLVELDLSDNAFGPIGVDGLKKLFKSSSCFTLEILRLNNNGLGITGGKYLSESLNECYEASGKKFALRTFQAGRNRLENPGAKALAKVFKKIGTLVEVSMPQNGIYHKGVKALSEAFKNNPHLKTINLNDNTVRAKGAAALAEALPILQNLETLNLGDCLLKTDGALLIAKALTNKHINLKTLILDHNEINIQGGMEFSRAMQNKTSLSTLNLNGNNFGEDGIEKITQSLTKSGRGDALQSFSDDEGSEEENDEESPGDNESSNDSCEESDEDEVAESCTASGDASLPKITIPEFLASPSSKNFLELGTNKTKLFTEYIEKSEPEDFIKNALVVLLTISNLCENNQDAVKSQATAVAVELYSYIYDWASRNDRVSLITNAILVQLRLLKAEEKSSLIECNENSCLYALQKAIEQSSSIPVSSKDMFSIFLQRKKNHS
ncbi:ran GTPase-activating protein 1 [Planococcus citri]|uniref:ran GTPase-activating protein 1 n=1 Tax=Planococcus citri TaxID=170843 RepID=UPI0031F90631